MSRFGDVYENRVTREHAVVLRGSEDRGDGPAIVHLNARPGAAVVGEHIHPRMRERFTVLRGRLAARIGGTLHTLGPGQSAIAEAGVAHDWWNPSATEEAHVLIEIESAPGNTEFDLTRFELLIGTLFGLANDGKVDRKGRPFPLQGALIGEEFADVVVFTQPPRALQQVAIGVLAPIARWFGYRATYEAYNRPHGRVVPDPEIVVAAGLPPSGGLRSP
jgi:quercetin dioxygenase-like cupin family protein